MKFEDTIIFPQIPIYPVLEKEYDLCDWKDGVTGHVDRVQLQLDPTRRAILVRHVTSLHWCGYVSLTPAQWRTYADVIRSITDVRVTYEGYSTQYICWMSQNQAGKFKVPTSLLPGRSFEDDFWIGFDTQRHPMYNRMSDDDAIGMIYGFENTVWSVVSGRLALGG